MLKVKLLICFLLFYLFVCPKLSAQQNKALLAYGTEDYPPFSFYDQGGKATGFNVELLLAVAEVMDMPKIDIKLGAWDDAYHNLKEGKGDIIVGMASSSHRQRYFDFSMPVITTYRGIFVASDIDICTLEDLRDKEVLVMRNSYSHQYLEQQGLARKIIPVDNTLEALRILEDGKHDCALMNRLQAVFLISKYELENVRLASAPLLPRDFCFAVAKGDTLLLSQLNQGLSIVKQNGTYNRLYTKWLGVHENRLLESKLYMYLFWILIPVLLVFLFVFFWNRRLHKKLQVKTLELQNELTERQQADILLKASREKFKSLIEIIPYGIIECDLNGRILFCNEAYLHLTGTNKSLLMGASIFDQLAHYSKSKLLLRHARIYNPQPQAIEDQMRIKSGQLLTIQIDWNYRYDNDQHLTGFIAVITNVHDRKRMERELMFERYLLQALMDNIPYQIYFKDTQCRFIRINRKQAGVIGVDTPDAAIGKTDFDYFPHAQKAYADEQHIIKTGEPLIDKEERIKYADGKYRWVSATKIAIKDDHGKVAGIVGISRDISEQRAAEEELRKAKEHAEESDRLKTAFLANMSHEIRTPMNAIIGFTELLNDPNLPELQRLEYLGYISNSGKTLLMLIDDIIDIAKIEAGQIKIKKTECPINKILDELYLSAKELRSKAQKNQVEVRLNKAISDQELLILSDPFRFRQIFTNLISNAIKFTEKGYIEFGYSLKNPDEIQFYAKDTGIGMPANKLNVIFERFGQVEDIYNKNQRGTGLGLAISMNLTKLLGGDMWVTSEMDKGSTFYFTLPYETIDKPQQQKQSVAMAKTAETHEWPEKTVLVAEDVTINFKLLQVALRKTKIQVLWAKNGQEAIDMCRENPDIDLVLMDIQMPIVDGYEATQQIKQFRQDLPIIAQTAFAMSGEKEKSIEAGCDSYITKPIKKDKLLELINHFFRD